MERALAVHEELNYLSPHKPTPLNRKTQVWRGRIAPLNIIFSKSV